MGAIRGKIWHPKLLTKYHEVGGPWPLYECKECGGWRDKQTHEHVASVTLEEIMKKLKIEEENHPCDRPVASERGVQE